MSIGSKKSSEKSDAADDDEDGRHRFFISSENSPLQRFTKNSFSSTHFRGNDDPSATGWCSGLWVKLDIQRDRARGREELVLLNCRAMASDLRHVMGAILTISMFTMLGNMVRRDHFDSAIELKVPETPTVQADALKVTRQSLVELSGAKEKIPWIEHEAPLKPCWKRRHWKGEICLEVLLHFSYLVGLDLISRRFKERDRARGREELVLLNCRAMASDLRHVMGAILTISMFMMLGNMVRRDHFDGAVVLKVPEASTVQADAFKVTRQSLVEESGTKENSPWIEQEEALKPCWKRPSSLEGGDLPRGFITLSLSGGPGSHISQIVSAIIVTRYLGATLVLPEIMDQKSGYRRQFGEIYDVEKFLKSLSGVIHVSRDMPLNVSLRNFGIVNVPYMVSEDYLSTNIRPLYNRKGILRVVPYFSSSNKRPGKENKVMNSISCLAMFEALHLKPELQEVLDSMILNLRSRSSEANGRFVAVDLRVEMFGKEKCQEISVNGRKTCYTGLEVGHFLQKAGFGTWTTVYLTQTGRHWSLDALKEMYPNICTKEDLMKIDQMKFLGSNSSDIVEAIDFHICALSDVYIPAVCGLFYGNVVGQRIASGKIQVLIPAQIESSSIADHVSSIADHVSPFIAKKNHMAYSCFC